MPYKGDWNTKSILMRIFVYGVGIKWILTQTIIFTNRNTVIGKWNINLHMERIRKILSLKILLYKPIIIVFEFWDIYLEFWLCSKQNVYWKKIVKNATCYETICLTWYIYIKNIGLYTHSSNVYIPILGSIKHFSLIGQLPMYH